MIRAPCRAKRQKLSQICEGMADVSDRRPRLIGEIPQYAMASQKAPVGAAADQLSLGSLLSRSPGPAWRRSDDATKEFIYDKVHPQK
jgi:hypothetical protein